MYSYIYIYIYIYIHIHTYIYIYIYIYIYMYIYIYIINSIIAYAINLRIYHTLISCLRQYIIRIQDIPYIYIHIL